MANKEDQKGFDSIEDTKWVRLSGHTVIDAILMMSASVGFSEMLSKRILLSSTVILWGFECTNGNHKGDSFHQAWQVIQPELSSPEIDDVEVIFEAPLAPMVNVPYRKNH